MEAAKDLFFPGTTGKLAVKLWRDTGKRVLALHGWLDNAATFDGLAPLLKNCQIAALDLPGHGLSDHRPAGTTYHFIDAIPDIVSVTSALGWETFHVLGHSLGGSIALCFAGILPKAVETLVVVESLGPFTSEAEEFPQRVANYLEELKTLSEKKMPVYASAEEAATSRQKAGDLTQASALVLASRGLKKVDQGYTWRSDPRLKLSSLHRLTEEQLRACLKRIEAPTLFIRASSGPQYPGELAKSRLQCIRNLQTKEIPGRHHVHLDSPETVAPLLIGWYGSIR